ncbi:hypothetical protein Pam5_44 [Pseudanabaena phage Pam5]|nr:hypothetical protein Pam5_44 [Pseudanabaena phage Pam5]
MAKFTVKWQPADGYVGRSRPQEFEIASEDFEGDDDQRYLEELFFERLEEEFRQKVQPEAENFDEFIQWALAEQAKKREAE